MKLLNKLLSVVALFAALLTISPSVFAYSCVLGLPGHCLVAMDTQNPNLKPINTKSFVEFCNKYSMPCSNDKIGNHTVIGRYLADDVFILAGPGFGGPDLILENKATVEQFIREFQQITYTPESWFYIKHGSYPVLGMVAVGYTENSGDGIERIKLIFLPNERKESGDEYAYVPPDE